MLIRTYNKDDLDKINYLGSLLHNNFNFSLDGFSYCLVIEENKEVVGFVIYSIIYERSEIVDIVIHPNNRKKGYAFLLLNYVINLIKKNNCNNITLEVNSLNTSAIKLYEKLGFKIETTRKKYYNDTDGYLMKKDLR